MTNGLLRGGDRGFSEWAVLVNNGGKYEKCNEFRTVDGFIARHIDRLSGNDVLVDLEGRGFFYIYYEF